MGILSKETGELKLIPAEQIFNLKQYPKDLEVTDDQDIMFSGVKAIQQKQILVEELGNKKSKKILKNLKNTIVKVPNTSLPAHIDSNIINRTTTLPTLAKSRSSCLKKLTSSKRNSRRTQKILFS